MNEFLENMVLFCNLENIIVIVLLLSFIFFMAYMVEKENEEDELNKCICEYYNLNVSFNTYKGVCFINDFDRHTGKNGYLYYLTDEEILNAEWSCSQ